MFTIFRDVFGGRLLGTFDYLQNAVDSLRNNSKFDLGPDNGVRENITLTDNNITLRADVDGADVSLTTTARTLHLDGKGDFTVQTAAVTTRVYGNDAENTYIGNTGRDIIYGGRRSDIIDGGAGDDVLYGGHGNDVITTGEGRDRIYGGHGGDTINIGAGLQHIYGGSGRDTLIVDSSDKTRVIIYDFEGRDTLDLGELGGASSLDDLISKGGRVQASSQHVTISYEDVRIELRDYKMAHLANANILFSTEPTDHGTLGYTPEDNVTEIDIDGVTYKRRDAEPLHESYKFYDSNGTYWSPDYFVVVVAGQSNAVGSGIGADFIRSNDVVAYDWVNDELVLSAYDAAPAGGEARIGSNLRNNLYFPAATELAEDLGQPVLVIAHPVSGSKIDTWLETGNGTNWANLDPEVSRALALVDQDKADAVFWHQGESDAFLSTPEYKADALALVAQMRNAEWGTGDMIFLFGELSKQGVNWVQNATLQELELENTDPNIGFVSSAGLISEELSGVHFNGQSLNLFGARYAQAVKDILAGTPDRDNTAPTVATDIPAPEPITLAEGQELRIDLTDYFTDAEGDDLYYYSHVNKRNSYFNNTDQDSNELILRPSYDHAGEYRLFVYANDMDLDGERLEIKVTITDADPLVTGFTGRDFAVETFGYRDLNAAVAATTQNRGLEILDRAAFGSNEPVILTANSLHITGDASISGRFILTEDAPKAYFYGEGRFSVHGAEADNYIWGSDGRNDLRGGTDGYGADRLYGNGGDDVLRGYRGDDMLYGGDGDDMIIAGPGNDHVFGGDGADTFQFARGHGSLFVRDFEASDTIDVRGFGFDDFDEMRENATFRESNNRLIIDIDNNRLQLSDVTENTLSEDYFTFG